MFYIISREVLKFRVLWKRIILLFMQELLFQVLATSAHLWTRLGEHLEEGPLKSSLVPSIGHVGKLRPKARKDLSIGSQLGLSTHGGGLWFESSALSSPVPVGTSIPSCTAALAHCRPQNKCQGLLVWILCF